MDIATIGGIVAAMALLMVSVVLGGGAIGALIDVQSLLIVIGGCICATLASFPLAKILKVHTVIMKGFFTTPMDFGQTIKDLVKYAELARREGILALESMTGEMNDPFIVRGIKMAVDGTDPELIKVILDTELETLMERHAQGKKVLDTMGKYAPAFGMIGTLMGLIAMLSNMDDPSAIGPGMALALITTLYGAIASNVFIGPIADKLFIRDAEEVLHKTLIITGVMSIQSGDNPRVVETKLLTFLPPNERDAFAEEAA